MNHIAREPADLPAALPPYPVARRFAVYTLLTVAGVAGDLWTKEQVFRWRGLPGEQAPYWIIENIFGVETAVNLGALFGMGQGYGFVFAAVSIIAATGILIWLFGFHAARSLWITVALGLVTGGILGNLYDRTGMHRLQDPFTGGVRDWILLRYGPYTWPNFNIADALLVTGAIMLALHTFWTNPSPPHASQS
jgi:signal peptidase II